MLPPDAYDFNPYNDNEHNRPDGVHPQDHPSELPPGQDSIGASSSRPGETREGEPQVKRRRTVDLDESSLSRWEPDEFKTLLDTGIGFEIVPEPPAPNTDLVSATATFVRLFDSYVKKWAIAPSEHQYRSLMVVALCVHGELVWSASSELLVTRLLGALFGSVLRAHSDSVYYYEHGSWKAIEQMPAIVIRNMESALVGAQSLFLGLYKRGINKDWEEVMDFLAGSFLEWLLTTSTMMDFRGGGEGQSSWACEAGKAAHLISVRYTGVNRPRQLCDSFGLWFQQPRPNPNGTIDFQDCTVSISQKQNEENGIVYNNVEQLEKSHGNDCYIHIPMRLSFETALVLQKGLPNTRSQCVTPALHTEWN